MVKKKIIKYATPKEDEMAEILEKDTMHKEGKI